MSGSFSLLEILVIIGVIIISLSIHEMMHALVGFKLGDDTAAEQGRISLNPLRHIDPFMTVLLPVITMLLLHAPILAAKPVPFNPDRVKYDEYGAAMIAAAGPLSNLLLAVIAAVLIRIVGVGDDLLSLVVSYFFFVNVSLFVFNFIPIPPLDGSRVLYAFAPDGLRRLFEQIEPYGLFIVFALVLGGGGALIANLNALVRGFLL